MAGLAYANRSAVYLEMGYFEKALENIQLARNHNYPKDKLEKLKDREEKCLELMNNFPTRKVYQEHKRIRNEVFKAQLLANQKTGCYYLADCLEVKTDARWGRHIVSNRDLKVGSLLAIEEPFAKALIHKLRYERCANCFKTNALNLFPCDSCISTMFCSEECMKVAQQSFHKYECEVAYVLDKYFLDINVICLRTFLEALSIFNDDPVALMGFLRSIENSKATVFDFDFSKMDEVEKKKTMLHTINTLTTGDPKILKRGIFVESCNSTMLIHLMLNHTKLGSILIDEKTRVMFRKFIFRHSQICDTNSHNLNASFENEKGEVDVAAIGSGIFPFWSLLNHSCAPNVSRVDIELKNYLRVKRPISAGQQLFDSYGPHHYRQPVHERLEKLKSQYKFSCLCAACQKPADYPPLNALKMKDLNFHRKLDSDIGKIERWNLKRIQKKCQEFCRYIDRNDRKNYPCNEIALAQDCIVQSANVLSLSDDY